MKIETYEVEEITGELGVMAADSEAMELINKMGLHGQIAAANPETATRFPYALMSDLQHVVFKTVFPNRTNIEEYADGLIPLRVLQVAAHVKELGVGKLVVWHTQSAKEDPLLVAKVTMNGGERFYLLARWGDALLEFDALVEKAKAIWKSKAAAKLKSEASKYTAALNDIEDIASALFLTGKMPENAPYDLAWI